jgi:hypothetical protein
MHVANLVTFQEMYDSEYNKGVFLYFFLGFLNGRPEVTNK